MTDIRRTILWVVFAFSLIMLWDNWQIHNGKPATFFPAPTASAPAGAPAAQADGVPAPTASASAAALAAGGAEAAAASERITLSTDVLRLTLDTRRMQGAVDGAPLTLSPLEYRLLHALAHGGGRPLSAGELSETLHGVDSVDANAIEALVARLRRKVGPGIIETRRGFGYYLAGTL